ncbi:MULTISPECIES: hypothetical protein [Clostridium]|nr:MULTISPECIES: hypothetical protein [Clostridium]MCR1951873.1 hypothetical protein [Clostridium sp. DSM 100503]MDI9216959.1 hypothetical protein [Clostridium tertium]
MKSLKIFFTVLILLVLVSLIFKFSFWAIDAILLSAIFLLLIDIFYVKA